MTQWAEQPLAAMSPSLEADGVYPYRGSLRTLMVLLLATAWFVINRQALWYFGFPVPLRTIATVGGVAVTIVSLLVAYVASTTLPRRSMRHSYALRIGIFVAWSAALMGLGLLENYSPPYAVVKEFAGFLILSSMLIIGPRDEIWMSIKKPLVIMFYVSTVLILLTRNAPAAQVTGDGDIANKGLELPRGLDTLAFAIHGVIDIAPLLFAWGMSTTRKDMWRILMITSLGVYVAVNVVLFEFRGAALTAILLVLTYAATTSLTRVRIPVGAIIGVFFLGGIVFVIASQTQGFNNLLRRFEQPGGMFDSRFDEAHAFFNDMSPIDLLIGRGLAGAYSGPQWAPMFEYNGHMEWGANHFGFLAFVLRGGFPFLFFMATFAVPFFLPKPAGWYDNEYNVTALILAPILLLNILFNPIEISTDASMGLLLWGLCFGRLSTSGPENAWQTPPLMANSEF